MNETILLVILVVFSFAISRLLSRYASRFFVVSGIEYLLLGIILGPLVSGILSPEALAKFSPLVNLLLGLVGFLLGLRARSTLRPANAAVGGSLASLALIALVASAVFGFLQYVVGPPEGSQAVQFASLYVGEAFSGLLGAEFIEFGGAVEYIWVALAIGCAAAVSSPVLIARAASFHRARGPTLELLLSYAETSQLIGIAVFGGTLVWARAAESADIFRMPITIWLAITAAVGILIGLLFNLFIGRERDEMRIYVAALGTVTFASGAGAALGVSPLIINLLAGIVVSYTSRHAIRLETTLTPLRHPILVLLRLFAGAMIGLVATPLLWLVPLVYLATRVVARWFTTWSSTWIVSKLPQVPRLGLGLVGQGGLAVAIAVSFYQRFPEEAPVALVTIVGGIILSDIWSYSAVRRILADAGETDAAVDSDDPSASRTRTQAHQIVDGGHGH
jgi:Kef-type K+ transport system membrane component KefB